MRSLRIQGAARRRRRPRGDRAGLRVDPRVSRPARAGPRPRAAADPPRAGPMSTPAGAGWRGIGAAAVLLLGLTAVDPPVSGQTVSLAEARTLVSTGRLDEAVQVYTRLLAARPNDLDARKERARVLGWLHRDEDALPDYDRGLQVTPRDTDAAVARARTLARLERVDEAEQALRGAIASHPRGADAHLALGTLLLQRGRVEEATASFTRARALAPGDPAPLVGLV